MLTIGGQSSDDHAVASWISPGVVTMLPSENLPIGYDIDDGHRVVAVEDDEIAGPVGARNTVEPVLGPRAPSTSI